VTVPYVIGVDLGGTATRVLISDTDGRRIGFGSAGGGNPISRGLEGTINSLGTALAIALDGVAADRVEYAVLGLAGVKAYGASAEAGIETVWREAGLTCPHALRPDAEVAYAAGTSEPDGFVVIAGTGAVAGTIRDNEMIESVDGHGWLLGDRGSGFFLGREAVLAALAAGEGYGSATSLRAAVLTAFGLDPSAATSSQIGGAVYQRPPVALAELAPLVTSAADAGDVVALDIIARAASLLLQSVRTLIVAAGSPSGQPVVLGGGLLTGHQPLRDAVSRGIEELGLVACAAQPSAVGAAALAVRAVTGHMPQI
jgi:N-acetylglucosamine kinase-like BadF-type ATPase